MIGALKQMEAGRKAEDVARKWVCPSDLPLKAAVEQVREEYAFSERRACGLMVMAVSSYRYQTRRTDEPLRTPLVELAREKPRFGYRRLHVRYYARWGKEQKRALALAAADFCGMMP